MISASRLREAFNYDPETGVFVRKVTISNAKWGTVAGYKDRQGYVVIRLDQRIYQAHRLAWLYMTGEWPEKFIDHINGIRDDNRFSNLREASNAENLRNRGKPSTNTSGFKGVSFHKRVGKWQAKIKSDGKRISLGSFDTPESAYDAYCEAAKILHGDFVKVE